MIRSAYAALPG